MDAEDKRRLADLGDHARIARIGQSPDRLLSNVRVPRERPGRVLLMVARAEADAA